LLNEEWFDSLEDARRKLALWPYGYNNVSPHSSLENQTPLKRVERLSNLRAPRSTRLPKTKTTNMKNTPTNSRYE